MVRRLNILIITILALMAYVNPAFSGTYYVAKTGNDTNTGTSWANAWATVAKVNTTISHGDTVHFGTGEWFASQIVPPIGTSEPKTVYACSTYTLASAHLATIYSGDSVGNWTLYSGNVYQASWTPSSEDENFSNFLNYPCVIGGDSIYNSQLSIGAVTVPGYFYYDPTNDILYIYPYLSGDPDVSGHRILASALAGAVLFYGGMTRYTEFFGLDLKMGIGGAICFNSNWRHSFNSFIHCNIAHNNTGVSNNSSVIYMGGYGGGYSDSLQNYSYGNVFRACSIYSATSNISMEGSSHAGSGCTFYGMRQTVFDSCYFSLMPGAGVMWKGGGLDYYGNRVSFSVFDATDSMPYGRASFTKLGVEHACGADRDSVYGCIFKDFYATPAIGMAEGDCNPPLSRYFGGDFFGNNTLYNCHRFFSAHAEPPEAGFEQVTLKYNVMYKVISGSSQYVRSSNTNPIFDDTTYCEIDSNYWYDPSYSFVFYDQTGTSRNWTYWTTTLDYDLHGYNTDPGLADPANGDFSRPDAPQEMYLTYGGQTWTRFGAVQGNPPPDTTAPVMNNIRSTDTTSNSVNIRWSTNEPASSQVEYGTTSGYGSSTQLDPSLVYTHVQPITGLSPSTTYHYRVRSRDVAGNEAVSGDYTFVTLAPDYDPPTLELIEAGDITDFSAVITWTTNEVATSQVNYGLTTAYDQSSTIDQSLVVNHTVSLSGLQPDTLYHFRVRSSDAAGNEAVSGDYTFHTDTLNTLILLSVGAPVAVCGTYTGYSTIHINDNIINPRGGNSTTWASDQSSSVPHWVEMFFDSPMTVSRVRIHWAWNSYNLNWMCSRQYYIQYWDVNTNSYLDAAFVNNSTVDSVTTTDFAAVTTTQIRYYQPANMGPLSYPSILWLTELELYGTAGIPSPEPLGTQILLQDSSAMVFSMPVDVQFPIFYEFALDTIVTFQNPRIEPPLLVDTVISTTFDGLSSAYTYYWRCRAIASDLSDTSNWSWTEVFTLYSTDVEVVTSAFPPDNAQVTSTYPRFEVTFLPVPESVYIEIDNNSGFTMPLRSGPLIPDYVGRASWQPDSIGATAIFNKNGVYYWRASADNTNWTTFKLNLKLDIHAYPVPFRQSDGHSRITFTNLPENSKISIATTSGTIVYSISGIGPGDWGWDVRNDHGNKLTSGVYLYAVESNSGEYRGKLMIIR